MEVDEDVTEVRDVAQGQADRNLPWVEKYRPGQLEHIVSHKEIIETLSKFISNGTLPHLLFYGPPGTGKTTAILAAVNQLYTDTEKKSMTLELNASDDRGIGVVRDRIVTFAGSKSLNSFMNVEGQNAKKFKLIILDEADSMTKDAQNALRRIIEKYTENVRFCILCNYLSSIIPAIQSRCTRFRFAPLKMSLISPRVDFVAKKENVNLTESGKKALLNLSGGDMRRVLNTMQSTAMAFPSVDEQSVYKCVGQPTPAEMQTILKILLNDNFQTACKKLESEALAKGYSLSDIIAHLHDIIFQLELPSDALAQVVAGLADCEYRLAGGTSDRIQIAGLVAIFFKARSVMAKKAKNVIMVDDDEDFMD
ncbi:hypothetical protein WR25_00755 [Diploscapter pachys]|uniref:Activator 1 subunit 5 n=1 Tax=Diploscapter pachys TaxID=2018661 RepID=A0A2A2LEQ3_9BILA|nr:hypothetical protein WR25_00755 [Diploscapter pachys]